MTEAIDQFQKAHAIVTAAGNADKETADLMVQLEEALGVAYLHKAEIENGVFQKPGAQCLLSSMGVQAFARTEASRKAIEHFSRYLTHRPNELEVKWLLNVAYMTVGAYPDKVPAAHLIQPTALASAEDVGRFVDVAAETGLVSFASAGGVIVDDFDRDGRFDVATSSYDSCAPMHLFRRGEDGAFAEQASRAGLGEQVGGLNLVSTDYNNDGCLDMLLLRGAWDVAQRKSLLRNNCDGTFADVTVASGLARPATSTQAAVWTDIDNDGFLDLFIGNEAAAAQLFRNKRDGTFEDIASSAGVARTAFSKGVSAADYDNDGWQDLFVTSYFTSVDESVRTYLKLPHNATTLKLYRNVGDGSFRDVTAQVGLDKVFMPMGAHHDHRGGRGRHDARRASRGEHRRIVRRLAAGAAHRAGQARTDSRPKPLAIGEAVPDFALTDQARRPVALSQLRGKVVAVNFIYTSCALPQFCFRIANHFGVLQKRFKEQLGTDVVLLTVTFDSARDHPEALSEYASRLKADPASWHFLTGQVPDVRRVCDLFGVDFFQDEGLMNHSSRTAVIDRRGTLVASIEGNEFSATQLGDLVQTVLTR